MTKVGVFWGYDGKIIAGITPFKDAVDDGLFVNSSYSHVTFWKSVREKSIDLRIFEYDEIPRGRVLFSKERNVFFIYMDRVLFNENFKRLILKEFELSESKVEFKRDAHYTTDKKKIYQLLDR